MALVVTCAACGKRLNIPAQLFESKIRGRVVTIACKQCGTDIKVDGTNVPDDAVPDSLDSWAPPSVEPAVRPEEEAMVTKAEGPLELPLPLPRKEPSSPRAEPPAAPAAPSPRKELKSAPGFERPAPPAAAPAPPKSAPLWERPAAAGPPAATAAKGPKKVQPALKPSGSTSRLGDEPAKARKPAEGITEMLWAVSFADDDDRELTLPEILRALRTGQISTETIVWREGMDGWKTIGQVAEFAPYVDSLERDEPTRLKRPEDVDALKAQLAALGQLPPPVAGPARPPALPVGRATGPAAVELFDADSEAPPPQPARRPALAGARAVPIDVIESLPPDVLSAVSEPPVTIDPNSPELIESIPPQAAVPRFDVGAMAPITPYPASAPQEPPRTREAAQARGAIPAGTAVGPEFSVPPSMPPELRPRVPLKVFRAVVLGLLGVAVLVLVVALARSPKEPAVTIPTGPIPSVVSPAAKPDAGEQPSAESSAALPTGDQQEGLDLATAIERSLGKGADKPGAPFNRKVAQALMTTAAARAASCRVPTDQKGPAEVVATFEPTGKVSNVEVKPPYAGTSTGRCLLLTFQALRMRPFHGGPVTMTQRVMVR